MAHTLLAVPVPEVDGLVRRLTAEWEPTYDLGTSGDIHAHITVLGPFVPLEDFDDELHDRLGAHFFGVKPFAYRLESVRVFPNDVVYLAPQPSTSFSTLTEGAVAAFPGYLPYGGGFESVIPHMTVGPIWSAEMERALVAAASAVVPVDAVATEVRLVLNDDASFRTVRCYPLGT